jgi:succinate-semialdehyde dehydrogenase/glutarate-semialdehyde dehydrogenase
VGPGTETGADIGPLIDRAGRAKVADAVERGAKVLVGGKFPAASIRRCLDHRTHQTRP